MASIKVKFRPSCISHREGTIYYQIIHERQVRQLVSGYNIFAYEWDAARTLIIEGERKAYLRMVREHIRMDLERFSRITNRLNLRGISYTSDDIINEFKRYTDKYSLCTFMESLIANLKMNGRVRTSETYTATLNSFKKFLANRATKEIYRNGTDIMLDSLSSEIMEAYEAWHIERGSCLNTISFYTRILRAVYNRALENDIMENRRPFRHVYTGIYKTVKRALPIHIIKQINSLDLSRRPGPDYARDMFMMSFMLRGISFIDMAYLRKSDLTNGYITYRRRKTGQPLRIKWTDKMQSILDKYPENNSIYLLPIIKNPGRNEWYIYKNTANKINQNLKKVAEILGITTPLTLYVARHSWASIAQSNGIPVSIISEGMGHHSEQTTRIYLASLNTESVDKANSMIIDLL